MHISLSEFLKTGALGDLRVRMPQLDVVHLLGPPDGAHELELREYLGWTIYKYDDLQIFFDRLYRNYTTTLFIEYGVAESRIRFPSAFVVDAWELGVPSHREDVERYLRDRAIPYQRLHRLGVNAEYRMLASRVSIMFDEDDLVWSMSAGY